MLSYFRRVTDECAVGRDHEIIIGGIRIGIGDLRLEHQLSAEAWQRASEEFAAV